MSARPAAGDTVTLYDGTTAVVNATRCLECETHRPHDECEIWFQVGAHRWVSEDGLR
jgi:hypothetical protein